MSETPKIKLRTPQYIYLRLLLGYTFLYILAFFFGCLLFHLLKIKEGQTMNARILEYFSCNFSGCDTIFDFARYLVEISRQDLLHVLFIFSAGFTMLAGAAVSALLFFRGFSLGFSASYLAYAIRIHTIELQHPIGAVVLYALLCAFGAAILLHYSVRTTVFSDAFKSLCGRASRIIRSKDLYAHLFRFLIALGAFLILNLTRCIL